MCDFAELAKSLRLCAEGHCESGCMCFRADLPFAGCTTDFDEDDLKVLAADAIENLQAQVPRWIRVADRLPEENGGVLVRVKNGNIYSTVYSTMEGKFRCAATHWTPLPPPPEEVE